MSSHLDLVTALNATIAALELQLKEAQDALPPAEEDPCAAAATSYNTALHIGAVFIILVASGLGVVAVLAGKRCPALRLSPLAIALGKTAGTGIVLATALVHMLLPSNESLTSACVPSAFNTDYGAYAYLFAMLAALAVQTVDMLATGFSASSALVLRGQAATMECTDADCQLEPTLAKTTEAPSPRHACADADCQLEPTLGGTAAAPSPRHAAADLAAAPADSRSEAAVPHTHRVSLERSELVALLMTELGFTLHSLFIGLACGVADDEGLRSLLVALCFHQFFEGIGLGARMIDANYSGATQVALALIFATAAPIGIGAGVGAMGTGSLNTNGSAFLLTQGISDGICAGILLRIGFSMIIKDFPADVERVAGAGKGAALKRCAMFVALWGGAGSMAFLGKYL